MTNPPLSPDPKPKTRRWRFRLSVRMLMLLVLVIGGGLGWVSYQVRQARIQRETVAAIASAGGRVTYDWVRYGLGDNPAPRLVWLRRMLGPRYFEEVIEVYGESDKFDDAFLAEVGRFNLEFLSLANAPVTTKGLEHLRFMSKLKTLILSGTKIDSLKPLEGLTQLDGNERVKVTHPERVKVTHLGIQNGRSGQKRQTCFTPTYDPSLFSSTRGNGSSHHSSQKCANDGSDGPEAPRSCARPGRSGPTR